jgi:mannonate dehydratase
MTGSGAKNVMLLTDYFYPDYNRAWDYAKECGVSHGVIRLPETADFDNTSYDHWKTVIDRLVGFGIRPVVLEPMPNDIHDHIKLGDNERDQSIDKLIKMLSVMDKFDIRIICFNFMAGIGWTRTRSDIAERGNALVTGFDIDDFTGPDLTVTEKQLWDNYEYFIHAVLPHAEKYGIKLALHPDDPPINPLGTISRIMISYDNIIRAMNVGASPFLGVTMCQATYYLMGEDLFSIIPKLRDKIHFIHFRNVSGHKYKFHETFHDNGDLPMGKLIRLYRDLDLDVPIRVDHVPKMAGEESGMPGGYDAMGRLFAIGYLKGLMEAR